MAKAPLTDAELKKANNGRPFHLSRDERDHIAGHALDSMNALAFVLHAETDSAIKPEPASGVSSTARKIAALSNLLGNIGRERKAPTSGGWEVRDQWHLGELFPVVQLRP